MTTEEQLVREYAERARAYARSLGWKLPGADQDDLEQEALIGLLRAVRYYDPALGVPFWPTFARMCIHRWLAWTLRRDNRERAKVLSRAARVLRNEEGELLAITEIVPDPCADVARIAEGRRELRALLEALPLLSELERRAVAGRLQGYSYAELGEHGSIDNALQRARTKLRRAA